MRSIIPWSWTTYEGYETCPRQLYEMRLAKNFPDDPNSEYLLWGNYVHHAFEVRVKDNVPLPANLVEHNPMLDKLIAAPGMKYAELSTAITEDLRPTGYWDEDCWNRGKEDLIIVNGPKAMDIDWKTGKKKNSRQLAISAVRVFAEFPEVEEITSAFRWLQTKEWTIQKFFRTDMERIADEFRPKVNDMKWSEKNNAWPARPSGLCKRSKKPGSTYAGCPVATCPHSEFYGRGR